MLDVLSHSPSIWPNAAGSKTVSDEREGKVKRQPEPVFWTVGVDEIPRLKIIPLFGTRCAQIYWLLALHWFCLRSGL